MICKCKNKMDLMIANEYIELYCCTECDRFALKNIELFEDIEWLIVEGKNEDI